MVCQFSPPHLFRPKVFFILLCCHCTSPAAFAGRTFSCEVFSRGGWGRE